MKGRPVELVLLEGGRSYDEQDLPSRGLLRVVRTPSGDLQAALEETVAAARKVRREIEERIARALDDLMQTRSPESGPG
jgi:hypothetical protein